MTNRLYFESDELTATSSVVDCQPCPDGLYRVLLTDTLFHPQGGGQPSDVGVIEGARVVKVAQGAEAIDHFTDKPLEIGPVLMTVDEGPRHLHARLHSAGHLIGFAAEAFGWYAVKGHHWPGEARVVFDAKEATTIPDAEQFQQQVNALIEAGLPRRMSVADGARVVGFGDLPTYACGGTHVASLADIGAVTITKIKEKKGQLTVQYDVAGAPL